MVDWCSGLTSQLGLWLGGGGTAGSIPRSVYVFCGGGNVCVHSLCMGVGVCGCKRHAANPNAANLCMQADDDNDSRGCVFARTTCMLQQSRNPRPYEQMGC